MIAPPRPPAPSFRLVRYFAVASLAVFLPVAATLLYFDDQKDNLFKQVHRQQDAFFAQMQESFVQRHDAAAPDYLVRVHEAGTVNLTRMLANALWEKDFAAFVAKAQYIPVDQCHAIADTTDADGKTVPPSEKQACFAEVGKKLVALPDFKALDAKVFDAMQNSTVFKIKVYDLRGITVYSSEHSQIGEDKLRNAGWQSAAAGKPASTMTHRGTFSAFEGTVENRDLIESYVPVRVHGGTRVVAVFEVYSDITPFLEQIKSTSSDIRKLTAASQAQMKQRAVANQEKVDAGENLMLALVLGMLALLYGALFLIVRNAQRIIVKQDVERKQAGLALARQKDLYEMLSHVNRAIVRIVDRDELFATVCRVAVDYGRFRFAWIGLSGKADRRVKVVARHGDDAGYVDQVLVTTDQSDPRANGPTGLALRFGRHAVSNDFLNDPATAPWHEAARRAGVLASAAFPIHEGGELVGAINLYAGEPGLFTAGLLATLDEISKDVSFALDNYTREAARRKAEAALREGEERYRQLFVANPHPMWVYDVETLAFLAVNDAAVAHYGWSREEFLAMTIADIRPAEEMPALLDYLSAEGGKKLRSNDSWKHRKKDGMPIDVEVSSHSIGFGGRHARIVSIRDITERKRAQEELRAAAERLRLHVELTPSGVIEWDADFRVVSWNPSAERIFGYTAAESLGRHASFILPLVAREQVDQIWSGLLSGRGGDRSINENITKAGQTIICEWHNTRLSGTDGNMMGVASLVEDVTERKAMDEKLRESEERFRNLLQNVPSIAVQGYGADGTTQYWNQASEQLYGYSAQEAIGHSLLDLIIPPEMRVDVEHAIKQMAETGQPIPASELSLMRKDKSRVAVYSSHAIVRIPGRAPELFCIDIDLTSQQQAAEALREAEAQFRGLVEQSIAGIYIIQDGAFAYVNPRFAEIRGYHSANEMIGLDPLPMIAKQDRGHVAENIRRLLAGEIPSIDYSFVALRKDGSSVEVGVHSTLATYRGRPAIIGLMQDISEKKRAEEQIEHYIAQLENAFMQSVEVATTLSEMRAPSPAGPERRVAEIAVAIGAELGFDARRQEGLRVAGYLHDVGKITVPAEILAKPTKLTPLEFQLIKEHPQASYDVLKKVEFPWPVAEIALQHHERIDGSGYPQGLKGDAILLEARILAVADTVEAMSSHRPYRPGLGIDKSLAEIERGRGTVYDANVADACLRLFREKGYTVPA